MSDIKNIKLNGTNLSLEEKEIKKIRYNGEEYTIGASGSTPVDNGPIYEGKYRVRYFDTDGTILKIEYVESGGRTTPPTAPSYDPDYLIFAEWNYDTDNYIVEQPTDIGATYDTVGDATYMFCRFTTNTGLNPTLAINGASSIDWGDGTVDTNLSHTYANEGEYLIKVYGDIDFNTTNSKHLFGSSNLNKALQKCFIKNGITKIGSYAFYYCNSLTNVTIPNSVTSIITSSFEYCNSLTNVIIPNSITSIGYYAFQNCYSLTNVIISNSVTSISDNAFQNCYSLTNVIIPKGVTSIGNSTFNNCYSLTNVIIPKGVTSIGSNAFRFCYSLINYFIDCDTIPMLSNTNAFTNINPSAIFWVNDSIIEQLKVATNWSNYSNRMKPRSWYPSLTDPNA